MRISDWSSDVCSSDLSGLHRTTGFGLHSRTATPEQIEAFGEALSNNLNRRYAKALLEIDSNTKIKVLGETAMRGGKIIRAKTEITSASGAPVAVDYLFGAVNGEWRAFDQNGRASCRERGGRYG